MVFKRGVVLLVDFDVWVRFNVVCMLLRFGFFVLVGIVFKSCLVCVMLLFVI